MRYSLLLLGMFAATPIAAQTVDSSADTIRDRSAHWLAAATYARDRFAAQPAPLSDWESLLLSAQLRVPRGALALEAIRVRRFDLTDAAVAIDAYAALTARSYGNLRVQLAPDADVLPAVDIAGELFHGFAGSWETSLSARWLDFAAGAVDLYGVALAHYAGAWYVRGRVTIVPANDGAGVLGVALVRRYRADDSANFVELSAGAGEEVVTIAAGPVTELRATRFAQLRAQHFITRAAGLSGALGYHDLELFPNRYGVSVGVLLRR